MGENTQEKNLIEKKEKISIFGKIKNFFKNLFSKKQEVVEEENVSQEVGNDFRETIKMTEDEETKLLDLQNRYRRGEIADNDLTDELSKFLAGFKMMYGTLVDVLRKYGVEEINRAGQIFDPKEEQALLTDCVADKEDEEVLEVLLKGYKLKGRVIRPASVKVNQK